LVFLKEIYNSNLKFHICFVVSLFRCFVVSRFSNTLYEVRYIR
jgi:hypothetical protein